MNESEAKQLVKIFETLIEMVKGGETRGDLVRYLKTYLDNYTQIIKNKK